MLPKLQWRKALLQMTRSQIDGVIISLNKVDDFIAFISHDVILIGESNQRLDKRDLALELSYEII